MDSLEIFGIVFIAFLIIFPLVRFILLPQIKWKKFSRGGVRLVADVIAVKKEAGADPGDPDSYFPKLKFVYEGKEYVVSGDSCHNPVEVCDRIPIVFDRKNPKDFVYDPPFR